MCRGLHVQHTPQRAWSNLTEASGEMLTVPASRKSPRSAPSTPDRQPVSELASKSASYTTEKKKSSDNLEAGRSNNPWWSSDQELPFQRQQCRQSVPGAQIRAPAGTAQPSRAAQSPRCPQGKEGFPGTGGHSSYLQWDFFLNSNNNVKMLHRRHRAGSSLSIHLSVRPRGSAGGQQAQQGVLTTSFSSPQGLAVLGRS